MVSSQAVKALNCNLITLQPFQKKLDRLYLTWWLGSLECKEKPAKSSPWKLSSMLCFLNWATALSKSSSKVMRLLGALPRFAYGLFNCNPSHPEKPRNHTKPKGPKAPQKPSQIRSTAQHVNMFQLGVTLRTAQAMVLSYSKPWGKIVDIASHCRYHQNHSDKSVAQKA